MDLGPCARIRFVIHVLGGDLESIQIGTGEHLRKWQFRSLTRRNFRIWRVGKTLRILRGRDLVTRVAQVIPLTAETMAHMNVVFGSDQIALRDAVAHGVSIANDETLINKILGGLTRTLDIHCERPPDSHLLDCPLGR
jgi:hypothetical protein